MHYFVTLGCRQGVGGVFRRSAYWHSSTLSLEAAADDALRAARPCRTLPRCARAAREARCSISGRCTRITSWQRRNRNNLW